MAITPASDGAPPHSGHWRVVAFLRKRLNAIGRGPERRERPIRSRHRPKQAEILRERRFALFG